MQNADDILLISPTRNAFELEEFAKDSTITFSLDTVPFKSKRKCLYLVGSRIKTGETFIPDPISSQGIVSETRHHKLFLSCECSSIN